MPPNYIEAWSNLTNEEIDLVIERAKNGIGVLSDEPRNRCPERSRPSKPKDESGPFMPTDWYGNEVTNDAFPKYVNMWFTNAEIKSVLVKLVKDVYGFDVEENGIAFEVDRDQFCLTGASVNIKIAPKS